MAVERVSTKAFTQAIAELHSSISTYEDARERIFSGTDKLFVDWEGEGKKSFEETYVRLKTQLKDEEENLRSIADNLENIKLSYDEWDSQVGSSINQSS